MGAVVSQNSSSPNFYEVKHGLQSWLFTTDHKRIALLYLGVMLTFFVVAVGLGLAMRLELLFPGETLVSPQVYNAIFTLHGVIMIFLFIIPGLPAVFGNFMLPIQIGAEDVAFPKLNLLSWWLFIIGAGIALVALFTGNGPPDTGWTFYAPYSTAKATTNVVLAVSAAFIIGFSSVLTGLNFVTTIHRMRAPGMHWFRMPLFTWSLYATGWVQVLATPVVSVTLLLVVMERVFGIGVFDPTKGGDPILYQHLFWIYSHPAVYIMILPAMGAISEIIPAFARRTIFGYKAIAMSSLSIALVGYLVWGHHMFTAGMSLPARYVFSLLTFFVAVPTAIKVFNWVASLYKGSIDFKAPMMFAYAFIFLFSIGGVTGLMNAALASNIQIHDTSFVVAHFHYVMFGGTGFAFFGALHYWFPKMFGKLYCETTARVGCAIFFIGFNLLYFPLFIIGWQGMPRRYFDYLPQFTWGHQLSTVGSWVLAIGLIIIFANLIRALRRGPKAGADPWGAMPLEWTVPSPPPLLNFEAIPTVDRGPYDRAPSGGVK